MLQTCPNDLGGSPVLVFLGDGQIQLSLGEEMWIFPPWVLSSRLATYSVLRWGRRRAAGGNRPEFFSRCLELLVRETAQRDVPLALVEFPVLLDAVEQDTRTLAQWEVTISERLGALGLPRLRVRESLQEQGPSGEGGMARWRAEPDDFVHLNSEAQQRVGEEMGQWLAEQLESVTPPGRSP